MIEEMMDHAANPIQAIREFEGNLLMHGQAHTPMGQKFTPAFAREHFAKAGEDAVKKFFIEKEKCPWIDRRFYDPDKIDIVAEIGAYYRNWKFFDKKFETHDTRILELAYKNLNDPAIDVIPTEALSLRIRALGGEARGLHGQRNAFSARTINQSMKEENAFGFSDMGNDHITATHPIGETYLDKLDVQHPSIFNLLKPEIRNNTLPIIRAYRSYKFGESSFIYNFIEVDRPIFIKITPDSIFNTVPIDIYYPDKISQYLEGSGYLFLTPSYRF